MNDAYKTETLTQHGKTYRVQWFYDCDMGAPWEEHDGHGIVSDWTRRDKHPGELVLNEDRGSRRFYDFAATVKKARAEGWNTAPYDWKTKGEQAAAAAMADFENLRRWCANQWHWCGIVVSLLDDEGEETGIDAALWGIEDDGFCSDGHHATVVQELIGECEHQENRTTYPVTHCAI
jgi:hypothetical protein